MGTLLLTPTDNNYLSSSILFRQLTQNAEILELDSDNSSSVVTPKIHLDGSGRAQLSGSFTLTDATPTAGTTLFSLPKYLSIPNEIVVPVSIESAGIFGSNSIKFVENSSGISSVNVTVPGSYTAIPTIGTTGPGAGATFAPAVRTLNAQVVTPQAGAGSYAPGDTLTVSGGTGTPATFLVSQTDLQSATIASGGSGGTDGTQTVTGTTGTGTKFQVSVTIASGAITAILSIVDEGFYTVNPTNLAAEPVTGAGLTGATLNIKMGPSATNVTNAGKYTVLPSSPAATTTSGSGTGCTIGLLTFSIDEIAVTAGGTGYTSSSAISITGAGVGGGAATIVLGQQTNQVVGTLAKAASQNDIVHIDGAVFLVNSYGT